MLLRAAVLSAFTIACVAGANYISPPPRPLNYHSLGSGGEFEEDEGIVVESFSNGDLSCIVTQFNNGTLLKQCRRSFEAYRPMTEEEEQMIVREKKIIEEKNRQMQLEMEQRQVELKERMKKMQDDMQNSMKIMQGQMKFMQDALSARLKNIFG